MKFYIFIHATKVFYFFFGKYDRDMVVNVCLYLMSIKTFPEGIRWVERSHR